MNTGKATWIEHPKHVITTLHSYKYEGKDDLCVMFTLGEEGSITLLSKCEGSRESEFIFLHTPNDYIILDKNGIRGKLFTVDISIPMEIGNTIVFEKKNEEISFNSDGRTLFTISNPAFLGSASFGIRSKGTGKEYIEVF